MERALQFVITSAQGHYIRLESARLAVAGVEVLETCLKHGYGPVDSRPQLSMLTQDELRRLATVETVQQMLD